MTEARIRATAQLRETPAQNSQIAESLGAGTPVKILEDQGAWLKSAACPPVTFDPGLGITRGVCLSARRRCDVGFRSFARFYHEQSRRLPEPGRDG